MVRVVKVFVILSIFIFIFSTLTKAKADCVAVIPAGWHHEFWRFVAEGAEQAGKDLGVIVKVRAPSKDASANAQKKIIQSMKSKGCKAFVIAPADETLNQDVEDLLLSGIPSVYIDRKTDGKDVAVSIVGTANYLAGQRAGREMAKLIGKGGNVGLLRMQKGINSTDERERGFADAVNQAGLNIMVDEYLGITKGDAVRAQRKIAEKLIDLDGLFTPNESTTIGVIKSISNMKTTSRPIHIGFDLNDVISEAIQKKEIHATIIQDPFLIGYKGVEQALQATNNIKVPRRYITPIHIVTEKNIASFKE